MLVLVRHGEATANAAGLLLGRADVSLTDRGRQQVEALRPHVGTATALFSSPLRRALDTAEGLSLGVPVEIDDRWIEIDYGVFDGEAIGEAPSEVWEHWREDPGHRPPGGESLTEVGARVSEACESLFSAAGLGARDGRGDVVVVSHVSPIKAAVAWATGAGPLDWRLHLSTGSITRIGWASGEPVLECFNWVPPLTQPRSGR